MKIDLFFISMVSPSLTCFVHNRAEQYRSNYISFFSLLMFSNMHCHIYLIDVCIHFLFVFIQRNQVMPNDK